MAAQRHFLFPYRPDKAAEATAFLLDKCGGRKEYLWLLRALYLAERQSLKRYGRTLIGGAYSCQEVGPVMDSLLSDFKEDGGRDAAWNGLVERHLDYELRLISEYRPAALSLADEELLKDAYLACQERSWQQLIEDSSGLPEYEATLRGRRKPLHLIRILEALELDQDSIAAIRGKSKEANALLY